MRCLLAAIWLTSGLACAQDPSLAALQASLAALRPLRQQHRDTRGATPALTLVKHRLRDWVESRLASSGENAEEDALNRGLQDALAGLFCPDGCVFTALGYIAPVRVRRQGEFLAVQTSVGIACGYDDSAYLYAWRKASWRRIFSTEQNNYTKSGYLPQTLYGVQVSPPDSAGARLILTLGSRPGCSNAFQPLYYRLWRIAPGVSQPKLLLDASETAFIGDYPPVRATLLSADLRIEFTAGGQGYGSAHQAERHFRIGTKSARANTATQVEPIAPTPRDFVEEWLAAPWKQSSRLSESASLQSWHAKFHRDDGMGDFPDPPVHCANHPDLWQIGIRLHGIDGETYYLVRWPQPDRFTLADISDGPLCPVP